MRLAFVGSGKIAVAHAMAAQANGATVAAASGGPSSPRLAEFLQKFPGAQGYHDWRAMLRDPNLNGVVVCAPWNEIENISTEIICGGLPCLIEKPLALSAPKARQIFAETRRFHDQVMIGYNRRFYDFIPLLRAAFREKELLSVDLNLPDAVPEAARAHALVYMTSHWLDLTAHLCGPLKLEYRHPGVSSRQVSAILSAGKVPVHLRSVLGAPAQIALTFTFADQIFQLKPVECLTIYDRLEKRSDANGQNSYHPHALGEHRTTAQPKPGFGAQMKSFLENCLVNRRAHTGCTMAEAVMVTELCESLRA